jgi:ubiquinone/menaquinone biosynthesis C-methylase UbiE
MQLDNFYQYSLFKKKFTTVSREPFFDIAGRYIENKEKVVLDIGSGEAEFFLYLKDKGIPTQNMYLLDANERTVEQNKKHTANSVYYLAPDKLPFKDEEVDLIHMSHLIDNLQNHDLYAFLHELSRVIKPGGYIIISTPLFWPLFYNDLSHTRPYNPLVFYKYFIQPYKNSRFDKIPGQYELKELVYRYYELPLDEGLSSTIPILDYCIITARRISRKLGFKRLQKNGYTLVLKKTNG